MQVIKYNDNHTNTQELWGEDSALQYANGVAVMGCAAVLLM